MADKNIKKAKYSPVLEGLQPNINGFMKGFKDLLMSKYGIDIADVITSAKREGKGTSQHLSGGALDLSIKNPIVHKLLNNTEDGLKLLKKWKLGVLDESTQALRDKAGSKSKQDHLHLAQGNSNNPNHHYNKTLKRLDTLTKDEAFVSHDDLKKTLPNYVSMERVAEEMNDANLTEDNKGMRIREEEIQVDKAAFDLTEKALADAKKVGKTEDIKNAKQAHEEAYIKLHNNVTATVQTARLREYKRLEQVTKDYEKDSPTYKDAIERKGVLYPKLYTRTSSSSNSSVGKNKLKPFTNSRKEILAKRKAIRNKTNNSWYENTEGFDDDALKSNIKELEDQWFPNSTGKDLDFKDPETNDKLIAEVEKKKAEQTEIVTKIKESTPKTQEEIDAEKKIKNEEKELTPAEKAIAEAKRINDKIIEEDRVAKEHAEGQRLEADSEGFMARFNEPIEMINPPNVFDYDKKNYKRDIPIEGLGMGVLGLMGLNDAKEELPLRDEQVSAAMLQYTATLKRLSEQGLKPEEEAKLKGDITGAYSQGIAQITRASGGNRNLVLGNLPGLNETKMDAIANMRLADVAIKQDNFYKYGEAIEKIQAFETNTKIANHAIRYDEAKAKRAGGAALASQSFATMLEDFQYQKENGPGSANHRANKAFEIMLTGVDSEIHDSGDGLTPNTPSWQMKNYNDGLQRNEEARKTYSTEQGYVDKFKSLSPKQQGKYNSYSEYREELINDQTETRKQRPSSGGLSSYGHGRGNYGGF